MRRQPDPFLYTAAQRTPGRPTAYRISQGRERRRFWLPQAIHSENLNQLSFGFITSAYTFAPPSNSDATFFN